MQPNLVTIPVGVPFLPSLAVGLLSGRLVEGYAHDGDPLSLAGVLIYVPTRRAARGLAEALRAELGGASAILPRIRPIGEGEEVDILAAIDGAPGLLPAMGELERRLKLARLTRGWQAMTRDAEIRRLVGEDVALPASAADALWLAGDLGALLDEVETEGVALSALAGLAPEELTDWWRLTLTFLSIVTEHWPAALAEDGRQSEAAAKNAWLEAETRRLREAPPAGPVILAGSTATAPAVLELMHAVAHLPQGALVLPGLDTGMDAASVSTLDRTHAIAAPGHPQYGLKRILERFVAAPGAVRRLAEPEGGRAARETFLADALRPAETTDRWGETAGTHPDDAFAGLALVEAFDAREEALSVACAMRQALSKPESTVALITPDRNLARRVVVELSRFGIAANDSAGRPLASTAPGTLVKTLIDVAFLPGDPIALLALLKHPLVRLGESAIEARNAARAIELLVLRGTVEAADGARLGALVAARLDAILAGRAAREAAAEEREAPGPRAREKPLERIRLSRPAALIGTGEYEAAKRFAARLSEALAPLAALRGDGERELPEYAVALTRALEALACDEAGSFDELYAEEPGRALADFLKGLVAAPATGFAFRSDELPDVVAALGAGVTVRPRGGLSARAFVWGTLEARLQHVDTAILGGLSEGTWPAAARNGAFLSRLMRRDMELDPPERRIGLSAHDFWMAMGAEQVILTRARRMDGAPTIRSRLLQRILTLAGPAGEAALTRRGAVLLNAARRLESADLAPAAARPHPRPPVERRPTRYSVTEVETLIRDPYAIHAKKILGLDPLPPLMRAPDVSDRGSLFHEVLADFVRAGHDPAAPDALGTLLALARGQFDAAALPPEIEALWWPRMAAIAQGYVDWERGRDACITRRGTELEGKLAFPAIETVLTGRADRIDRLTDGTLHIVDFKTGSGPSLTQARILLSPQLALEGGMARRGAFEETATGDRIAELAYVRLKERSVEEEGLTTTGTKTIAPIEPNDLSEEAIARFLRLATAFRSRETPFTSRTRPFKTGDYSGPYDHLARAREWVMAADDETGEE